MSLQKNYSQKRESIEYPIRQHCSMNDLRQDIDQLDRKIVELLSIRQGFMEQAARIKQDRDTIRDEARIEDVVSKVLHHGEKVGANTDMVEKIYRDMIEWSINYEMGVFEAKG